MPERGRSSGTLGERAAESFQVSFQRRRGPAAGHCPPGSTKAPAESSWSRGPTRHIAVWPHNSSGTHGGIRPISLWCRAGPRVNRGTIDLPISRDPERRTRMTARLASGRHAHNGIPRAGALRPLCTLLEVHIGTGRTHQIRVHLAALGHPVVPATRCTAPPRTA